MKKAWEDGYREGVACAKADGRKAIAQEMRKLIHDGGVCVIAIDEEGGIRKWTYGEIPKMVEGWTYLQVCRATLGLTPYSNLVREVR